MKKKLFQLYQYILYRLRSKTTHGTHSPFVFDLLNKVIYNPHPFYAYEEIEKVREKLLKSTEIIQCIDMGAGESEHKNQNKTIQQIARRAVKPAKYGQLLFRLANYFQPQTVLELGTSLGITTSYLRAGNKNSQLTTIEGCPQIANIAKKNWKELDYGPISLRIGNFDTMLPEFLKATRTLDFVFFDGNHRKQATLDYFKRCLIKANENTIFIFDDIYWSVEMKEAWEEIKADERVVVTIDIYFMGFVFFRKGQAKENFVIRY